MSYRITQSNGTVAIDHAKCQRVFKNKSVGELQFIIIDTREALEAMPSSANANVYADEALYAHAELRKRENAKPKATCQLCGK